MSNKAITTRSVKKNALQAQQIKTPTETIKGPNRGRFATMCSAIGPSMRGKGTT